MKKLIFVFSLFLSLNSFAQETKVVEAEQNEPEFKSDRMIFNQDKNSLELIGKVDFKTAIIELIEADKIVFNRTTNEIVVTGLKDFVFDGEIVITGKAEKQILRYIIGEKIAYVE